MVIVAHFDEPITNKASAERNLVVTDPIVQGSWYWVDDYNAHWRPRSTLAPGTSVTVKANIFGVPMATTLRPVRRDGVVPRSATPTCRSDDKTAGQRLRSLNGKLVRTMPTSMGKGGHRDDQRDDVLVLDTARRLHRDGQGEPRHHGFTRPAGLPINPGWATRRRSRTPPISTDGIYLHQLNATSWAQGNTNVSHGCLNLNSENARFFNFSPNRATSWRSAAPAGRHCSCGRTGTGPCRGVNGAGQRLP